MGGWGLLLEDSSGGANYAVGESRSGQGSWGISQQVVGCGRFLHLQNKLKLQVFFIMLLIFKEIFELCMHFYIVILYHLSQLDLLVTLNAASRKHLLKSWDPVMLYLLHFIFISKNPTLSCMNLLLLLVHFSFITAIISCRTLNTCTLYSQFYSRDATFRTVTTVCWQLNEYMLKQHNITLVKVIMSAE